MDHNRQCRWVGGVPFSYGVPMKLPATLPRPSQLLARSEMIETTASYLGLSQDTIKSYRDKDHAPKAAHWAIYWISPEGRDWLSSELGLNAQLLHAQVRVLRNQVKNMRDYIAHIEGTNDTAANAAAYSPPAWRGPSFKGTSCSTPIERGPSARLLPLPLAKPSVANSAEGATTRTQRTYPGA